MDEYRIHKAKAVILFILNHAKHSTRQCCSFVRLYYVLYIAEKKHYAKYFCRIIEDCYIADPYGPVPSLIHNLLMDRFNSKYSEYPFNILSNAIDADGCFMSSILYPKEDVDIDYLSKSEIECLLEAVSETNDLSIERIQRIVCDEAWSNGLLMGNIIDDLDIAKAAGLDAESITYIKNEKDLMDSLNIQT